MRRNTNHATAGRMLDRLEDRRLLSVVPATIVQVGGILTIDAGNQAMVVDIDQQENSSIEVNLNGQPTQVFSDVTGIVINGSRKADDVCVCQTGAAASARIGRIVINTDGGDDHVELENSFAGADIRTGNGRDTVEITSLEREPNSTINTGHDDDVVTIRGETGDYVHLGEGDDRLYLMECCRTTIDAGSGADVVEMLSCADVTYNGQRGADALIRHTMLDSTCCVKKVELCTTLDEA